LRLQRIEKLLNSPGRILQARAMVLRGFDDQAGREAEKMENELIWMLGLDVEGSQDIWRKVAQITRADQTSSASDRGR
jgi:hypothetical protein